MNSNLLRDESFDVAAMHELEKTNYDTLDKIGEQWKFFKQQIQMKATERCSILLFDKKNGIKTMLEKLTKH